MKKRLTPIQPDEDDIRLFRDAIGPVREIRADTPPPPAPRPEPRAHMLEADEAAVPGELLELAFDPAVMEVGEELSYLRDGYQPRLLRQLKRGQFSIQDELDLHHMNTAAAQSSIASFLAEARQHGLRCVRIVHGKGLRSKAAGPVLKALTDRLLRRRDDVVAFASAKPAQGGTGAVIVLLKNS
ncbi:Smr/MutS family protein [Frateuria terrea]|uniref:DNA-nicking endonuclease, Smr domain n=1 Tax=Frateuria terrea TaxID=529704 RepID=A0A1H6UAG0_9GAMM|nr:Smr/MutS family protein [Frateuria terrea]SEI84822.1 DNA-nicking endonuclease, Smr domain [Frateuria terrea]SFP39623.1 DNA-nicking endonuclease, Smr domain [Frateuria terrea]